MMVLYDEQEVMCSYVESERQDEKIETAKEMLLGHEPIEKIIKYSRLPRETILELQKGLQQDKGNIQLQTCFVKK